MGVVYHLLMFITICHQTQTPTVRNFHITYSSPVPIFLLLGSSYWGGRVGSQQLLIAGLGGSYHRTITILLYLSSSSSGVSDNCWGGGVVSEGVRDCLA